MSVNCEKWYYVYSMALNIVLIIILFFITVPISHKYTLLEENYDIDRYFTNHTCYVDYIKFSDSMNSECGIKMTYHFETFINNVTYKIDQNTICIINLRIFQHFIEINNQSIECWILKDSNPESILVYTFTKPFNIDTIRISLTIVIIIITLIINSIMIYLCCRKKTF